MANDVLFGVPRSDVNGLQDMVQDRDRLKAHSERDPVGPTLTVKHGPKYLLFQPVRIPGRECVRLVA